MNGIPRSSSLGNTDYPFRHRYETLRALLNANGRTLQMLCDLEADLNHLPPNDSRIRRPVMRLIDEVLLMAHELNLLARGRHAALYAALGEIREKSANVFREAPGSGSRALLVRLGDELAREPGLVGGKAAGAAFLNRVFPGSVPDAFVMTTAAYTLFLEGSGVGERLRLLMRNIDVVADPGQLALMTQSLRSAIRSAEVPTVLTELIDEHAARTDLAGSGSWAVRSSAATEDTRFSFAGQFDTLLFVDSRDLKGAYQGVLSGRFSDRAVMYRRSYGLREVDTPMAVLFMPMIEPMAAGVIYTRDPQSPQTERMVLNCVDGVADRLVRGLVAADSVYLTRQALPRVMDFIPAGGRIDGRAVPSYVSMDVLVEVGRKAYQAMEAFGSDVDIEWAVDRGGRTWLLQCRGLRVTEPRKEEEAASARVACLAEGGITVFPGRAEGPVFAVAQVVPNEVPRGSILVVDDPTPDLAPLLPQIGALVAAHGSPIGHLATLLREYSVPALYRVGNRVRYIARPGVISVDATNRKIYAGSRWPGIRDTVLARLSRGIGTKTRGPLFDLVLSLQLKDPFSQNFKARSCRSIHDAIRFIHEMAVRAMFNFGDRHNRLFSRGARPLDARLPMRIYVLDLQRPRAAEAGKIPPGQIESVPFQAFWEGFSDPALPWPDRWDREYSGLPSDFREQVFGGARGPRRPRDANYIMVAPDYLNFNARFAYHYAMVDTVVGPWDHNNYVHFRFHGGGADDISRQRRCGLLERVLRESGFGVDLRGDLVIAWLRGYTQKDSLEGLSLLGRLMVCARQLDALMRIDDSIKIYSQHFLSGNYGAFAG